MPDPFDEHVVAAAVVGGAGSIVTLNTKDFPIGKVPATIDVVGPPEFAASTVELDPRRALTAVSEIAGRSGRRGPRLTSEEVMDILERRYGMAEGVGLLREATRA